jgi:hypothetical protein
MQDVIKKKKKKNCKSVLKALNHLEILINYILKLAFEEKEGKI